MVPRPPAVTPRVAQEAAEWLVELQAEPVSEQTRAAWQHWRAAHPDHEAAWRHIESVGQRWRVLASPAASSAAHAALSQPGSAQRRRSVKNLAALLFTGGAAAVGAGAAPWDQWLADQRTGIGERRSLTLADGSALSLNSASAVDIRFDGNARRLRLLAGEVLITTGHAGTSAERARPFLVETAYGAVRALGTRFCLRLDDGICKAAVYDGAVQIVTAAGGRRQLDAMTRAAFSASAIGPTLQADEADTAWRDGMLVAGGMRLEDFAAELARHRRGVLRCDPAVADLRLSGSYPLDDTDRVLKAVSVALPVEVNYVTRYWASLRPRGA